MALVVAAVVGGGGGGGGAGSHGVAVVVIVAIVVVVVAIATVWQPLFEACSKALARPLASLTAVGQRASLDHPNTTVSALASFAPFCVLSLLTQCVVMPLVP